MKKFASAAVVAFGLSTPAALAADLTIPVKAAPAAPAATSPWDIAFGGALMNDYEFRGITQSAHKPSVAAYSELRYNFNPNLQVYYANAGESIDFPNHAAAEIDFYGGIRPTFDKLALDFGFWYYYYPGGITFNGLTGATSCTNLFIALNGFCNILKGDVSFWEVYGKGTYTFSDTLAVTADVYYSPSWLNSGAYGLFASGIVKLTAPSTWFPKDWGGYFQAELGHYWFGTTDAFYAIPANCCGFPNFPSGIKYPDYTTWNIGVAITYKVFTLDLRYWDTDLSKADCNVLTGDHTATINPSAVTATNPRRNLRRQVLGRPDAQHQREIIALSKPAAICASARSPLFFGLIEPPHLIWRDNCGGSTPRAPTGSPIVSRNNRRRRYPAFPAAPAG